MLTNASDAELSLLEPSDLARDEWFRRQESQAILLGYALLGWLEWFLCRPHPNLGRDGPICPYVRTALDKRLLWLTIRDNESYSKVAISDIVLKYREWFLELEPVKGDDAVFKTILLVFPKVIEEKTVSILEDVQTTLKPSFLEKGLMIGRFHPQSNDEGARNPAFTPWCPIPLLAIRTMTRYDLPFLSRESHLEKYIEWFGGTAISRSTTVRSADQDGAVGLSPSCG